MTLFGHVQDGQIVFEPPVLLPNGAQVRVEVVEASSKPAPRADEEPTLAQKLMKYAGQAKGLPTDLARNHDHYVHGTPRE